MTEGLTESGVSAPIFPRCCSARPGCLAYHMESPRLCKCLQPGCPLPTSPPWSRPVSCQTALSLCTCQEESLPQRSQQRGYAANPATQPHPVVKLTIRQAIHLQALASASSWSAFCCLEHASLTQLSTAHQAFKSVCSNQSTHAVCISASPFSSLD